MELEQSVGQNHDSSVERLLRVSVSDNRNINKQQIDNDEQDLRGKHHERTCYGVHGRPWVAYAFAWQIFKSREGRKIICMQNTYKKRLIVLEERGKIRGISSWNNVLKVLSCM